MNELGMEEHLGAEESLIADVNLKLLTRIRRLVQVLLEFVVEVPLAICRLLLLVILGVLSRHILAHVTVLLFADTCNLLGIFTGDWLLAVPLHLQDEFSDVATGQRNVLDAAADDEAG